MESLMYFIGFSGFRKKSIRFALALFFWIAMNLSWLGAEAHGETFVGKAVNSKGTLEYVEYHTVTLKNGKVSESQTIYYDGNNKIVKWEFNTMRKIWTLVSQLRGGKR